MSVYGVCTDCGEDGPFLLSGTKSLLYWRSLKINIERNYTEAKQQEVCRHCLEAGIKARRHG